MQLEPVVPVSFPQHLLIQRIGAETTDETRMIVVFQILQSTFVHDVAAVIHSLVITSYSIHYTKLYERGFGRIGDGTDALRSARSQSGRCSDGRNNFV